MRTIRLENSPDLSEIRRAVFHGRARRSSSASDGPDIRFLGSGKAAIAAVLGFLRQTGVLANKNSEVLVPRWLGIPVYQQITNYAFPVFSRSDRTNAVLAYHQYGFPQDMDPLLNFASEHKLTLIEDCAHAVESFYKNGRLGSFGQYAIYSFSKFTFCFALGGVSSPIRDFSIYLDGLLKRQPSMLGPAINFFKLIDEWNFSRDRPRMTGFMTRLRLAAYSLYGESPLPSKLAMALWQDKGQAEIATRRKYFSYLRERARDFGVCDHLEIDGVAPYAIPIRLPEEKARALVATLQAEGVQTGIYHFDMKRCLLEPDFAPCVLLPCHGGISESEFDKIVEIALQSV